MNVSLTRELEVMVKDKVRSGMYHSASEVIRAGLRLLKDQDQLQEIRLAELRKDIAVGVEQADSGQAAPMDIKKIKTKARSRKARRT